MFTVSVSPENQTINVHFASQEAALDFRRARLYQPRDKATFFDELRVRYYPEAQKIQLWSGGERHYQPMPANYWPVVARIDQLTTHLEGLKDFLQ